MSLGGLIVTSNGGRIYEHVIERVVVGLILLKLHPKEERKPE